MADYRDLDRRAAAIGAALRATGVAPGDRVALFMKNRTEYLEVLYGAWYAGATVVPMNAKLHPREVAWFIDNAKARVAFTTADMGLGDVAPDCVDDLICKTHDLI